MRIERMNHPLRENLEVHTDSLGAWIRCSQCSQILCRLGENWRSACRKRLWPPTKAGPLMKDLAGFFVLEQLYCPGCGALLNTDIVEKEKYGKEGKAQ